MGMQAPGRRSRSSVPGELWAGLAIVAAGALIAGGLILTDSDDPAEIHESVQSDRKTQAVADMESALKNAATAEEIYFIDHSMYTSTIADLEQVGLKYAPEVTITAVLAADTDYCFQATHEALGGIVYSYDSRVGAVQAGACSQL